MKARFDEKALLDLLQNLYTLTGIRANVLDPQGREFRLFHNHPPFCAHMNALPEGHLRCVECDLHAMQSCTPKQGFQFYRCHAGICEAILPLCHREEPLAYLMFGCFLDDTPLDVQWKNTAARLTWCPDELPAFRAAFFQFRQFSPAEVAACAGILNAFTAHIQVKGLIQASEPSDLQRLEDYLDAHYMDRLSLALLTQELHIGRTRLCGLARELSQGHTLSWLIARRRLHAAKQLLQNTSESISAIAETVGFSDYNYFSKVFRAEVGMTPSAFRKHRRPPLED